MLQSIFPMMVDIVVYTYGREVHLQSITDTNQLSLAITKCTKVFRYYMTLNSASVWVNKHQSCGTLYSSTLQWTKEQAFRMELSDL